MATPLRRASSNISSGSRLPSMWRCSSAFGRPAMKASRSVMANSLRGLRPAPRRPVHRGPADPEQNLTLRPRDAGLASVFQTREGALAVLIESVASAALQLGAAALLCLIAWAIFGRRRWGLRAWLGLKAAPAGLVLIAAAAGAAGAALLLQAPGLAELASGPGTVIRAVVGEGRPGAVGLAA